MATIVQFAPCYVDFSRESGGVANVVQKLCLGLTEQGHRVVLVCGNRELGQVKAEPGTVEIHDNLTLKVVNQWKHPLLGPVGRLRRIIGTLPEGAVAHVHTCFSAFTESAMKGLSSRGIPYVFTPHGKLSEKFLERSSAAKRLWWDLRARNAVAASSRVVLCSREEAAMFDQLRLSADYGVVPNGFDHQAYASVKDLLSKPFDEPYILYLGYLDPRKQPEFLVRGFAVSQAKKTHKLVIAGPDSYGHRAIIEREIARQGVEGEVVLYGPAYGRSKWELFAGASCFCLPSLAEGLPIVLCEALGCGLPLIVSSGCNFGEAAAAGAALVPAAFDERLWAEAIDAICLSSARREEMAVRALAFSTRFRWDNIIKEWMAVYDGILRAHEG